MARPSPRMRLTSPAPSTPITPRGGSPLPSPSTLGGHSTPGTPSRSGPAENTYQRTFKAIIKNATLINSNWHLLHTKWSDSLARIEKLRAVAKDKLSGTDVEDIRAKQRKQAKALEDEQVYLLQQHEKLVNQVDQLKKNSKKAEELLLEMSKRKGFEAAFAEPLFLTWPLARFVDALSAFTNTFIRQLASLETPTAQATSDFVDASDVDDDGPGPNFSIRVLESRRREFLEICEVETTPLAPSNG
ncbi:hypothetical protein P389DRAFT_174166 [Cystobasidium minutum MCA 4210]|uniref:uncharacterized protein n=1 Tax=Cystobasidium minutum MCA 4210 TaxID=1397322 RepID=UPI0034CEF09F|eukprot:jgi/Rhomi1/174166/fgenesh1_kg.7_\